MSYFPRDTKKAAKFIADDLKKEEEKDAREREDKIMNGLRKKIIDDIRKERRRQIEEEGFRAEHDNRHTKGILARAGGCYASRAFWDDPHRIPLHEDWPWSKKRWKPKNPRRDLIRAAALIVAELEKLHSK